MKIAFQSDLHLEASDIYVSNPDNADVLILAGDIAVVSRMADFNDESDNYHSQRYHEFFIRCSQCFDHVIMVCGNHEFYHGDIKDTVDKLKQYLKYIPNLHILNNESIEINGYLFCGATLWTDMNNEDVDTLYTIKSRMNDFKLISNRSNIVEYKVDGERKYRISNLLPIDTVQLHRKSVEYFESMLQLDKKTIIISHHTPSFKSVAPQWAADTLTNGAYHSDLAWLINKYDNLKGWFCGHTHDRHCYTINQATILCNPRGYRNHDAGYDTFMMQVTDIEDTSEILDSQYWSFFPR